MIFVGLARTFVVLVPIVLVVNWVLRAPVLGRVVHRLFGVIVWELRAMLAMELGSGRILMSW